MSKKMQLPTLLLASLALLAGCTDSERTERPPRQPESLSVVPLASHIALSANINLQKIQSDLNESVPDPIATFSGKKSLYRWNGEVKKRGAATISGSGQKLNFTMPLHAWVRGKTRGLIPIRKTVKTDITVTADAFPRLNSDWSLTPGLAMDFKWDKRPEIRLFKIIKVRLSGLVEPKIREQLQKVEKQINAEIRNLDIRGRATQAWEKSHVPIKLSSDPEVWLRLKPKAVRFSGIHTQGHILAASVSMDADMETILGERPDAFPVMPLPELGERAKESGPFLIRLPIVLEYEALRKEIEKVLRVGQKWAPIQDKPNHNLTVKEVEVYPSEENIVVGINFIADLPDKWQDTRGSVYLQGKPVIDNEQRIVRVKNLDFTRTTDNTLINVATLLFSERIKNELSSALTYRFGDEYDKFIHAANGALNRDFGNGLMSQGVLKYAKVDKVVMLESGIYLSVISEGELKLNFGL